MTGPRHDADAERIVLGSAMLDHRVIDDCDVRAEDFYRPGHEDLWRLITTEHRAGRPTDLPAIAQRLTTSPIRGIEVGYPLDCANAVPTAQNGPYYARVVAALAQLRRLEEAGVRLVQAARETPWDKAAEAVESARSEVDQAAAQTSSSGVRTYGEALAAAMEEWERAEGDVHPSGWADLDNALNGGWRPGHLTVVGARPAVGKSVIAACASKQAAERAIGVTFFAMEMTEIEVVGRIAANASGVDLSHLTKRDLNDMDWQRLARHSGVAYDWPLAIDDRPRLSVAQMRAKVRTVQRRFRTPLVVVDYLQLARPAPGDEKVRERQVSRIAEDLKLMAREFGVHVLALAQVNRGPEGRSDKRPTMSDLRESGGIEAHADEVIMLHRDDKNAPGEIELHVEKNRHGRTGQVVLAWAPHVSAARDMYRGGVA